MVSWSFFTITREISVKMIDYMFILITLHITDLQFRRYLLCYKNLFNFLLRWILLLCAVYRTVRVNLTFFKPLRLLGGVDLQLPSFLNLALDGSNSSVSYPFQLRTGKRTLVHKEHKVNSQRNQYNIRSLRRLGGVDLQLPSFLILALDGSNSSVSYPFQLRTGKRTLVHKKHKVKSQRNQYNIRSFVTYKRLGDQ